MWAPTSEAHPEGMSTTRPITADLAGDHRRRLIDAAATRTLRRSARSRARPKTSEQTFEQDVLMTANSLRTQTA